VRWSEIDLMLLRRMGRGDLTAHGFRATFKTWASERTAFQNETVEVALAHVVGSKVEQAYRRGDLFAKRRGLMDAWAAFCATASGTAEVVPLRSRGADSAGAEHHAEAHHAKEYHTGHTMGQSGCPAYARRGALDQRGP
jgi:hypothetical protein